MPQPPSVKYQMMRWFFLHFVNCARSIFWFFPRYHRRAQHTCVYNPPQKRIVYISYLLFFVVKANTGVHTHTDMMYLLQLVTNLFFFSSSLLLSLFWGWRIRGRRKKRQQHILRLSGANSHTCIRYGKIKNCRTFFFPMCRERLRPRVQNSLYEWWRLRFFGILKDSHLFL